MNCKARLVIVASFTLFASCVHAQVTATEKQLSRIDFSVSGVGNFTRNTSGPVTATGASNVGRIVSLNPSNTLAALVTLRYIKSPYAGGEFNYSYARYTENYSTAPFGVQTQANELTLGYVVTPPHKIFGFQPFASVGAGAMVFKPTPRGGQGLLKQAEGAYYYSAGIQQEYLSSHFGVRASFRQVFFVAPDFYQNYLTTEKRTFTSEPTLGFYVRF